MSQHSITVIGAGCAGCAAALTAARCGREVRLFEQRPENSTSIHEGALPCELTGSNDLGVEDLDRATGLLKAELQELCPAALRAADSSRIGEHSLMVDRSAFALAILAAIESSERITLIRDEVRKLPGGIVVLATGPTTWSPLARGLHHAADAHYAFSWIGRAPLVSIDGIDLDAAEWWPPYPGAEPALFLPVADEQLQEFARRLAEGERDNVPAFTGEMMLADQAVPIERLAAHPEELAGAILRGPQGPDVPEHGPMLRLDPDDTDHDAFHIHGCLTALTAAAQSHALKALPGFARAKIVRPGTIHRIPRVPGDEALLPTLQLERTPRVLVAGTLTGVYGYAEALATGAAAGLGAARLAGSRRPMPPPPESLIGALCRCLAERTPNAQGRMIRANFGMVAEPAAAEGLSKRERRERQMESAIKAVRAWLRDVVGESTPNSRS